SHLRNLRNEVHRELLFAVGFFDDGDDLVVHEIANGLANHQLVFGEERVDIHVVNAGKAWHGCTPRLKSLPEIDDRSYQFGGRGSPATDPPPAASPLAQSNWLQRGGRLVRR